MAFSPANGNGRGGMLRGRRSYSVGTLSEINVVPLVDVVLVLLIIFMITAQAMQSGLDIDVPQVKEVAQTVEDLPVVSVSRSGRVYLNDKETNLNALGPEIAQRFPNQKSVYVRADRRGTVETFVYVVNALHQAKFNVSVVVKQEELPNK